MCKHCKKGRVCLDVAVMLVNLLRRGQRAQGLDTAQLDHARVDLLLLSGHWEKELVVEEVGGRHVLPCHKCTLPATIAATVLSVIDSLDPAVSVAPTRVQWSTVFPGDAFPETTAMQLERIRAFFGADRFEATLKAYFEHLVLKADRIKTYEGDVDALLLDPRVELWLTDYAMATKLVGTFTETEADFLSKDVANNLGVLRVYCENGELWHEHHCYLFRGAKDGQSTLQALQQLLAKVQIDRTGKGMVPMKQLKV